MDKLFRNIILIFVSFLFFFFPTKSEAHNGVRDELGGHFRKADCVYLLHDPSTIAKSANNMEELIQLIKIYNSNASCKAELIEDKVDLEGYTFSKQLDGSKSQVTAPETVETSQSLIEEIKLGEKYDAELVKCVDGDTAHFSINGKVYKTRFLYIDTPESTNQVEPFGEEASAFTCNFLKSDTITLETDGNSVFDKYGRLLAWVWVGDKLLQEEITKAGFVEGFYDYGDYLYEDRIISAMEDAKKLSKGIYAPNESNIENDDNKLPPSIIKTPESENGHIDPQIKENAVENEKGDTKSTSSFGNAIFGLVAVIFLVLFFSKRIKRR